MLAAAKAGFRIVDVDPSITTVADVRSFLTMSNCKALFFQPVSETSNNLLTLRKAIPEFYECKLLKRSVYMCCQGEKDFR